MSEWIYVGAAFGLTWVVLAGYLLHLNGRTRQARQMVESSGREGGR